MTLLRRRNERGLNRLTDFLTSLTTDAPLSVPVEILTDPATAEGVGVEIKVNLRTFGTRMEAARYLDDKLSGSGLRNIDRDRGLWAWLALFYFEELCPPGPNGWRDPGEHASYLLEPTKAKVLQTPVGRPLSDFPGTPRLPGKGTRVPLWAVAHPD